MKTSLESEKRIEDIVEGDSVLSYDHKQKKSVKARVTQLFKSTKNKLVKVIIGTTVLLATPNHPFFANNHYTEAKDLHAGDSVLTYSGDYEVVRSVSLADTSVVVYNFEVENNHNYFVGKSGVLVHNQCRLAQIEEIVQKNASDKLDDFERFANTINANTALDATQRANFTSAVYSLDEGDVVRFIDDFAKDATKLNEIAKHPEWVDAWRKMFDLGDAIPDAIRKNPDILSKTQNWSDDLYAKLATVKDRNPKFFDNPLGKDIQKNPEILDYFEEGASIINNKSGNLKAVDLDMYALDRARTGDQVIFKQGTTEYVTNSTRDNYANLHRIDDGSGTGGVNLQSGKIRDANGNVITTDNVNGEGLMYVIDEFDNIHIGGRGGNISYPHPTLIGGTNPNVKCAGMIRFKDGRILEVNRNSGHFKPSPDALQEAQRVFTEKFPQNSFDSNFRGFIDGL